MPKTQSAIWDVHHHWVNEGGYIDRLLRTMDRLGIERTGLIAMGDLTPDLFVTHGPRTGCCDNEQLAGVVREHPDRFWGWGYMRLGRHDPADVDRLADMGMKGLKFHVPLRPYGEPEYFPVYERAQCHGLVCLFHTGIFSPPVPMPGLGIRSENCRPIHLEPISHEFPELNMIIAHLGICWNDEAAALCRMSANIYADLSGRVDGWRSARPLDFWRQVLYWPTAHRKILFGSDVHADEVGRAIDDHRRIFEGMNWSDEQISDVMGANAKRLMGGRRVTRRG
jgi:predicted TIM-barrel fold metal-dependent hydrolase